MSVLFRAYTRQHNIKNKALGTFQFLRNLCSSIASSGYGGGHPEPPYEPIPNRPLRSSNPKSNRGPETGRRNSNKRETDNDFLERFKLGFDRKLETPNPNSAGNYTTHAEKTENVEPLSPHEGADEIFKKMKETGLIPNAVAMLDGLCKDGLVQDAMKLFGLMREKGSIPEVVVYTAVVEGFCKAQKFDDAVRIFKKMQSNCVVPNAFSYGVLIRGLCKGKRLEDGYAFGIEMLEAGHCLNLETFVGLVDGYCREKGLEEAQNLISSLRKKGFCIEEKAIREYLDKKGPFLPLVWEAILGKKASKSSLF